jgi:Family of unknown function (DUF5670)
MLETIIIILLILWLVGFFGRGRFGGRFGSGNLINLLLLVVVILVIVRLLR